MADEELVQAYRHLENRMITLSNQKRELEEKVAKLQKINRDCVMAHNAHAAEAGRKLDNAQKELANCRAENDRLRLTIDRLRE